MAVRTVAAVPRRYGNYTRNALENFVRAEMSEDDACTSRANSNALGSQTKYWRLIQWLAVSKISSSNAESNRGRISL